MFHFSNVNVYASLRNVFIVNRRSSINLGQHAYKRCSADPYAYTYRGFLMMILLCYRSLSGIFIIGKNASRIPVLRSWGSLGLRMDRGRASKK